MAQTGCPGSRSWDLGIRATREPFFISTQYTTDYANRRLYNPSNSAHAFSAPGSL